MQPRRIQMAYINRKISCKSQKLAYRCIYMILVHKVIWYIYIVLYELNKNFYLCRFRKSPCGFYHCLLAAFSHPSTIYVYLRTRYFPRCFNLVFYFHFFFFCYFSISFQLLHFASHVFFFFVVADRILARIVLSKMARDITRTKCLMKNRKIYFGSLENGNCLTYMAVRENGWISLLICKIWLREAR